MFDNTKMNAPPHSFQHEHTNLFKTNPLVIKEAF